MEISNFEVFFFNPPKAEEMIGEVVLSPARKLEDLIRLAELCVDLLRQNEEFYAEVNIRVDKYCKYANIANFQ